MCRRLVRMFQPFKFENSQGRSLVDESKAGTGSGSDSFAGAQVGMGSIVHPSVFFFSSLWRCVGGFARWHFLCDACFLFFSSSSCSFL